MPLEEFQELMTDSLQLHSLRSISITQQGPEHSNQDVVDTLYNVLSDPYILQQQAGSLMSLVNHWITVLQFKIMEALANTPWLGSALWWLLIGVTVVILARIIYVVLLHSKRTSLTSARRGANGGRVKDPWAEAQSLAGQERYTEAIHALYLAVLFSLAQKQSITLHDSTTAGEYRRQIRRRGSDAELQAFIDFVRLYQRVVFGLRSCDSEIYKAAYDIARSIPGQEGRA